MLLKQKDGSETRIFEIIDNGLKIVERNEFVESERIVAFERISNNLVKLKFNTYQLVILSITILLIILLSIILRLYGIEGGLKYVYYLLIALVGGIIGLIFKRKNKTILSTYGEKNIEFYKNSPNKLEFNSFLERLFKKRNEVLKRKYGFVSKFITYEEQNKKFDLLHALGIISLEEMNQLKNELNSLVNKDNDDFIINLN